MPRVSKQRKHCREAASSGGIATVNNRNAMKEDTMEDTSDSERTIDPFAPIHLTDLVGEMQGYSSSLLKKRKRSELDDEEEEEDSEELRQEIDNCYYFRSILHGVLIKDYPRRHKSVSLKLQKLEELIDLFRSSCVDPTERNNKLLSSGFVNMDRYTTKESRLARLLQQRQECTAQLRRLKKESNEESRLIDTIIDMIVNFTSRECTPTVKETGISLFLSGASQQVFEKLNHLGISCSYDAARRAVNQLQQQQLTEIQRELKQLAESTNDVLVVYLDNYNKVNLRTRFINNRKTTTTIPSLSVIFSSVRNQETVAGVPISHEHPAFQSFHYHKQGESLMEGIEIPPGMRGLTDTDLQHQSLKSFTVYPSLNVQSSSYDEVYEHLINKFLYQCCDLGNREVIIIVDPEFILHFQKVKSRDPQKLKNLIMFPATFHLRKGVLESCFSDPVLSSLLFLPYLHDVFHYSPGKVKEKYRKNIEAMIAKLPKDSTNTNTSSTTSENTTTTSATTTTSSASTKTLSSNSSHITEQKRAAVLIAAQRMLRNHERTVEAEGREEGGDDDDESLDDLFETDQPQRSYVRDTPKVDFKTNHEITEDCKIILQYIQAGLRDDSVNHARVREMSINYPRLLNLSQLLCHAFQNVRETLQALLNDSSITGISPAHLVYDYLDNGLLAIATQPFEQMVVDGTAESFLTNCFSESLCLLAFFNRDKLFKAYFESYLQLREYAQSRPDLFQLYLENIRAFNDVLIEHHNSRLSRLLSKNQDLDFNSIRNASLSLSLRDSRKPSNPPVPEQPSSPEVVQEETRWMKKSSQKEVKAIERWLVEYFKELLKVEVDFNQVFREDCNEVVLVNDLLFSGYKKSREICEKMDSNLSTITSNSQSSSTSSSPSSSPVAKTLYEKILESRVCTIEVMKSLLDKHNKPVTTNLSKPSVMKLVQTVFPLLSDFITSLQEMR